MLLRGDESGVRTGMALGLSFAAMLTRICMEGNGLGVGKGENGKLLNFCLQATAPGVWGVTRGGV